MPSPHLTTRARCLRCSWTAAGDWADTDNAAQRHTKAGHPTATVTEVVR